MRMPSYTSCLVLNTSLWVADLLKELKADKVFESYLYHDLFLAFFEAFNEVIQRGDVHLENRRVLKENVLATMVANLEGGFVNPKGMAQPVEFEPKELDILVKMVYHLTDDLLLSIEVHCLQDSTTSLEYLRLVGNDLAIRYRSNRHVFTAPGGKQLRMMHRVSQEDVDHDLKLNRHWI